MPIPDPDPARPADVDPRLTVPDHALLLGGLADSVAENRAAAQRWARLLTYYRRREADQGRRNAEAPNFALTARQHTVVEVGELWGMSEAWTRKQLNVVLYLAEDFPFLWDLCRSGRCDTWRATLVADLIRHAVARPEDRAAVARRIRPFLVRHLRPVEGLEELCGVDAVLTCSKKQLRNKVAYELKKVQAASAEERFRRKHAERAVTSTDGEDGISWLTVQSTTDKVLLARRRLTLTAKQLQAHGDERTLDQLRSDLAIELLTGCTSGAPLPAYARPVVNLTVPIQTVMGLSDDPGMLSGGTVVPAALARVIAQQPGGTWHRMLTDPAGRMVELSTASYRPTKAIWEHVVAEHGTCFRSGCDVPATEAELDHRVRWPEGKTEPGNLWPGCKTDHKAKHAPGFSIVQTAGGSFELRTPAGFRHRINRPEHPVGEDWRCVEWTDFQYSATEIVNALEYLRVMQLVGEPIRHDIEWEYDTDQHYDNFATA